MPYDPEWQDMSEHVVHFARDYDGRTAYQNMLSILGQGRLEAKSSFGLARDIAPAGSQLCVCFSEIPMHLLSRLADRRGDYGIGFTKAFVASRGGAPVWYPPFGTPAADAIWRLANATAVDGQDQSLWSITPFVDVPGTYPNGARYEFEWEREWRMNTHLSFATTDPAFLIIPESLHGAARCFFEDARAESTGPCYDCPYVDPRWDADEVDDVLGLSAPQKSA